MPNKSQKQEKALPKKNFPIVLLVLAITFLCFLGTLKNDFLINWDDLDYVMNNEHIHTLNADNIKHFFNYSTYTIGNYHPLTLLTYAIEYHFFGAYPAAFHATNVFIHLANLFLVFALCFRLSGSRRTGAVAAFLFGIHPMHVESVAWISERKDVLYAFFFLFALLSYLNYLRSGKTKDYIITFLLFTCSTLSKSAAAVFPLILFALDFYMDKKIQWKSLLLKLPFFVLSILIGLMALESQKHSGAMGSVPSFSMSDRVFLSSYALCFYLVKIIIPYPLSAIHFWPVKVDGILPMIYYLSPLLLVALAVLVIKARRYKKEIVFATLFFIFNLVLVLQLVPFGMAIAAERYTYLPYIGAFFLAGVLYDRAFQPFDRLRAGSSGKAQVIRVLMPIIGIAFCMQTWIRCTTWQSGKTLFEDVISKYPQGAYGHYALGVFYSLGKKHEQALPYYDKAIQLDSTLALAWNNRGSAKQFGLRDYKGALEDFTRAIHFSPDYAEAWNNRGFLKIQMKDYKEAIKDFNTSIALEPNNHIAYNNRAGARQRGMQDFKGAIEDYTTVIRLRPDYYIAYSDRGTAKGKMGDYTGAIADLDSALALQPDYTEGLFNRGYARLLQKNYKAAAEDFSHIISIDSRYAKAYFHRAECYLNLGQKEAGCRDLQEAAKLGVKKAGELGKAHCGVVAIPL